MMLKIQKIVAEQNKLRITRNKFNVMQSNQYSWELHCFIFSTFADFLKPWSITRREFG